MLKYAVRRHQNTQKNTHVNTQVNMLKYAVRRHQNTQKNTHSRIFLNVFILNSFSNEKGGIGIPIRNSYTTFSMDIHPTSASSDFSHSQIGIGIFL